MNHPNSESNTSNLQIPLRYITDDNTNLSNHTSNELFWEELGEEIEYLANINQKEGRFHYADSPG